jgi:hypothetical protein
MLHRFILCSFVFASLSFASVGQALRDTAFVARASENATKLYDEYIRGQAGLYVGAEYKQLARTNDDHPFFNDLDWQTGSVVYDGEEYTNVPLLLDLTSDNIITENWGNAEEIVLVKSKVASFTIGAFSFVHLNGVGVTKGLPGAGFYEVLYNGPTTVLARHTKLREERIESAKVEVYFTPKSRYYVLKDGVYHKVSKRAEFVKLFKERKQDLKGYIQKEKLHSKNPNTLAYLAKFYDSLNVKK